ncbi:putative RNA-directed DNA polymerase from transposon X-element [Nephila pilipes]|uniref:Putative RNA-directed DNA polymerase from transposon X-element n=1 Tax=Nephila pilipes TaxID=299642 RepID=A0A8X6QS70_NEPPI|nr:putative RNA-directed DNA polymerase from transposon X-element [Nephila pilipes]
MILKRLIFYLNSHNFPTREQYGFRERHSLTDQVLYFCQRIRDAQNMKPTNPTLAAFLDLSKALVRVWRQKLIIKLFSVYGICGRALAWNFDFLRNRLTKVKFSKFLSESFRLHQGVPQGSVLSLILFSLLCS